MAQHKHKHKHPESGKHTGAEKPASARTQMHKDWRVWLVIALMLTAMIVYVLTLDDSMVPVFMRS